MIQDGLDLNLTAEPGEPCILGKTNALLAEPDGIVNCAIAGFLIFGDGMVDLCGVLFDLEVIPDQRRPQETIHIVVGIENEPRTSEVAPIMLKCLRV